MQRFKKYWLFVWYSIVGTGVDWVFLKLLSFSFKSMVFITILKTGNFDRMFFDNLIKYGCTIANIVSYAIGVATTFFLSAKYAFKINDNIPDRIKNTILIQIIGLLVQSGLFAILIHNGFDENPAKIITICENAVLMGAGNIFVVFRNYRKEGNNTKQQKKVSETWVSSSLIYGYFFLILKDLFSFVWFRLLEIMWLYRYSQSLSHKLIILEFPLWLIFFLF